MPARRIVVAALAVAFLLSLPWRAAAQKTAFVDAFIEFHSALPGPYGDEGARLTAALDRMAASLDAWERANRSAEQRVRNRPGTTPADLALVYVDELKLSEARDAIAEAITAEPRRAPLYVLQGLLHQALGDQTGAGSAFTAAHAIDPSNLVATYLLAAHLAGQGENESAQPLAAALMNAAESGALIGTASFPELTLLDDLSAKWPIFSPPLYADAFALMASGRFHEALDRFRTTAAHDPLISDAATRTAHGAAGIAALRDGRGAAAIRELESAVMEFPSSSEIHRVLGVAYRATGRLADSIAQFETAVRLAPPDHRARLALGTTLIDAGRLDEAERVLRQTIATLPESGDARWVLAQVYERLDRGADAIATLESAVPLTVMAGKSHLYWRIAQLAHGYHRDYPRVIAVVTRRMWLAPNAPGAHKDLGMAYLRAGRMDDALGELAMAMLLGLEDAETLSAIGQIHLAADRLDAAERVTRRAVARDGSLPQARYVLGTALRRLGRVDESLEHLAAFQRLQQAAFEQDQRTFDIDRLVQEARRMASSGRLVEAVAAYEQAAARGASPDIYRELAAIYGRLGRDADRARALAHSTP